MTALQLELPFMHEDPVLRVDRAIKRIEDSATRNRKCLHAKTAEAIKIAHELQERLAIVERHICKGRGLLDL